MCLEGLSKRAIRIPCERNHPTVDTIARKHSVHFANTSRRTFGRTGTSLCFALYTGYGRLQEGGPKTDFLHHGKSLSVRVLIIRFLHIIIYIYIIIFTYAFTDSRTVSGFICVRVTIVQFRLFQCSSQGVPRLPCISPICHLFVWCHTYISTFTYTHSYTYMYV